MTIFVKTDPLDFGIVEPGRRTFRIAFILVEPLPVSSGVAFGDLLLDSALCCLFCISSRDNTQRAAKRNH